MANTFGILAALVLAFSAFVAFKNKEEFEIQKKETDIQETNRDRNSKTYQGLLDDVKLLVEETETANGSKSDYQAKLDTQNEANDELKATIAEKERELETVTAKVADAEDQLKELGPIADLAPKIGRLNGEIEDLTNQVAVLQASIDRLQGEKDRTAEAESAAKTKLRKMTSGQSLSSMETTIDRIDRRLGFVTLADGIKAGVVGGSRVAVIRGGEKIAELSVTAVSANAATADILFSTVKEDMNVAVGDKVIPLEGTGAAAN